MGSCDCPPRIDGDGTWDMEYGEGPCRTWPLLPDCSSCFDCEDTSALDGQLRVSVEMATEILWRLTAGRFGLCREIVRPCRQDCYDPDQRNLPASYRYQAGPGMRPDIIDGRWVNLSCGCTCLPSGCSSCSCGGRAPTLVLPGPVYAPHLPAAHGACTRASRYPVRVWVDGAELSPDAFRVEAPDRLIRVDGGSWPGCQDLRASYDQPGAFAVEYWRGKPVPVGGRRAVTELACELYKKCTGDASCALPERVQTVNREGITYTFVDQFEFMSNGRTGLRVVDAWISSVNPQALASPPGVWSPDQFRVRHEAVRPDAGAYRGRGWL